MKTTYQDGMTGVNVKEEFSIDLNSSFPEYREYKNAAINKIRQNDRRLTILKKKIKAVELNKELALQLTELEKRNSDLALRIHHLDVYTPEKWDDSKHRFNDDLNKIGKSIAEIADLAYN